jgi:hypothetical protein
MMKLRLCYLLVALATIALAGCGDDGKGNNNPPDGNTEVCGPGENGVVAETDDLITVRGQITCPVTWTPDKAILLDGLVFVAEGGELTIEAGTTVYGLVTSTTGLPSALVVSRKGTIDAQGTAADPIVFTSSNPLGERASSDWGGVVLLGRATTNKGRNDESDEYLIKNIEGIDPDDDRGIYGGDDDTHDCGTLRYVRIEFGSAELSPDNELNGLTIAGCGSQTTLEYIQVHRADDDGIEFFGGTASIHHAVVSGVADDGLDWDESWAGSAHHLIVHKFLAIGDNGIEADNNGGSHDAQPRSNPNIEHMTLIGQGDSRAMLLRVGTAGRLSHFLVAGFSINAEIRDQATANLWASPDLNGDELVIRNSFFHQDGTFNTNVAGFEFATEIAAEALNNVVDSTVSVTSASATTPNYAPNGAVDTGVSSSRGASYAGAIDPAGVNWTTGWTAFPAN